MSNVLAAIPLINAIIDSPIRGELKQLNPYCYVANLKAWDRKVKVTRAQIETYVFDFDSKLKTDVKRYDTPYDVLKALWPDSKFRPVPAEKRSTIKSSLEDHWQREIATMEFSGDVFKGTFMDGLHFYIFDSGKGAINTGFKGEVHSKINLPEHIRALIFPPVEKCNSKVLESALARVRTMDVSQLCAASAS